MCATFVAHLQVGENVLSTAVSEIGASSSFAPCVNAKAPAVAARRTRSNAVEDSRATARGFYAWLDEVTAGACGRRSHLTPQTARAIAPTASAATMIQLAYGTATSLIPDNTRITPNATRSSRSGTRTERCEPISTPGIEPTSSHRIACVSTSP